MLRYYCNPAFLVWTMAPWVLTLYIHSPGEPRWRPEPPAFLYGVMALIKATMLCLLLASVALTDFSDFESEDVTNFFNCHSKLSLLFLFSILSLEILFSKLFDLISADLYWRILNLLYMYFFIFFLRSSTNWKFSFPFYQSVHWSILSLVRLPSVRP